MHVHVLNHKEHCVHATLQCMVTWAPVWSHGHLYGVSVQVALHL